MYTDVCIYRLSFSNPLAGVEYHLNKHEIAGFAFMTQKKAITNANISFR